MHDYSILPPYKLLTENYQELRKNRKQKQPVVIELGISDPDTLNHNKLIDFNLAQYLKDIILCKCFLFSEKLPNKKAKHKWQQTFMNRTFLKILKPKKQMLR